jgi:general secretion pathway protein K
MTGRPGERGAALVVTLVFAAAMAAAAVAFIGARRSDAITMHAQVEATRAQAILQAALQQTGALLANRTPRQIIPPRLSWSFDDALVQVRIESEAGKIDINRAEEGLLRALPMAVGLDEEKAAAIADAILDWRDDNDLKRNNGAEDRDYARAGRGTSGAADRPFNDPAELRYLLPIDQATWTRLAPLVTIYSGAATPERTKALPLVRRAVAIARGFAPTENESDGGSLGAAQSDDGGIGDSSSRQTGESGDAGESRLGATAGRLSPRQGSSDTGFSQRGQRSGFGTGAGESTGFGASESTGFGAGDSGQGFGTSRDAAQEAAEEELGEPGSEEATGVHTLFLDVRFPNGYEAAAKAVISLAGDEGTAPFVVLSWAPSSREQSDRP